MRRRHSTVGTGKGDCCSTWKRWMSEAQKYEVDQPIKEEEGITGGSDSNVEGNSSDQNSNVLRKENAQDDTDGRGQFGGFVRDNSEQQRWEFPPSGSFDYLGSSVSSVCGNSISSSEVDFSGYTEMVDGVVDYGSDRDDADVDLFETQFEDAVQQYARAIYSKSVSGVHKYISSLIVPPGSDGVYTAVHEIERLIDIYPPKHWYIVASHGDHIHVSHICPNSNESCRCAWLQRSTAWAKYGKRGLRRITRAVQLEPVDYANILRYLSKASRFVHRVGGFAEDVRLRDRYKHLSVSIKTILIETTIYPIE